MLTRALEGLTDARFWAAQPAHFGTRAAQRAAAQAQALLAERLQGLPALPGVPGTGSAPVAWSGDALVERAQGALQARTAAKAHAFACTVL